MDPNQAAVAAEQAVSAHIYLDWRFWGFVVAAIALVLSQLPPLHILLRRAKLEVEAYSLIALTHKVGNPNIQLHDILRNVGGRSIRVSAMSLRFRRGDTSFTIPAKNYLAEPNDSQVVMFTSQVLKPDQEWGHVVNFLNYFSKDDEREFRRLRFNLRNDIRAQRSTLKDEKIDVPGNPANVAPIMAFYEKRFVWEPGEYRITLTVEAKPARATIERNYRITLFESDIQQLRDFSKAYPVGGGIIFDERDHESVVTPLISEGH